MRKWCGKWDLWRKIGLALIISGIILLLIFVPLWLWFAIVGAGMIFLGILFFIN